MYTLLRAPALSSHVFARSKRVLIVSRATTLLILYTQLQEQMRYYALLRLARIFSRALRDKRLSFPKLTKGTTQIRNEKLEMENGEMEK